tara:strand:+ start:8346 stop:8825 length:480 start_codon:yes stop_codon:yes gene_type:complete
MIVNITTHPLVVAEMDMDKFEKDFSEGFDLEKASNNNIVLISCELENKQSVVEYIYNTIDWGNIFMLWKTNKTPVMRINIHKCKIEGFTSYKPDKFQDSNGKFEFEEIKEDDECFLVTNDLSPRIDKHIEFMLSQNLIDYVNFEWKFVVELENEKRGNI